MDSKRCRGCKHLSSAYHVFLFKMLPYCDHYDKFIREVESRCALEP